MWESDNQGETPVQAEWAMLDGHRLSLPKALFDAACELKTTRKYISYSEIA